MKIYVEGVGLLGPGLNGWHFSLSCLTANEAYVSAPTELKASELLPAAERRRTGVPVKLSLAVGQEAFANAQRDPATTATVFSSSGGDGDNLHHICETLAVAELEVSPTRFHNSVHNAAAGYWSIATHSQEPSTSLCCYDASFSSGLLESTTQIVVDGIPVALIAYDHPYPEPLHAVRHIGGNFGVALVLTPNVTEHTFAALDVSLVANIDCPTPMTDPALETLRASIPAARALPLLAALARKSQEVVFLEYVAGNYLRVAVQPC
ncbi:beta-ketoacyl synthase chain length factor [Sulfurirhabdus autotrophica]|uniref:Beta-ketoacyl synthase-like protein n=1 Tax=Sulfurirhabdus autotrophica TaxID=1706046 RepID=A0A4R3Y5E1_9PROT|nr:beta-ketoacyl synthase chain length factor [Sulfurirhabdus autotrophica]TCV87465.1 beta-ketoacyl synthase-like protein [Sulfurirhabdus autotrophica]